MPELPKVTIITKGYKEIDQDYEKFEHIILEDLPAPQLFNQGLESSDGEICCVLTENEDFTHSKIVSNAVEILYKYPEFAVVYGDCIINGIRHYYPSHDFRNFRRQDLIINTPFFFKRTNELLDGLFNEQLDTLYYYDALKKLSNKYVFHHISEPLFLIESASQNYLKDLNMINN